MNVIQAALLHVVQRLVQIHVQGLRWLPIMLLGVVHNARRTQRHQAALYYTQAMDTVHAEVSEELSLVICAEDLLVLVVHFRRRVRAIRLHFIINLYCLLQSCFKHSMHAKQTLSLGCESFAEQSAVDCGFIFRQFTLYSNSFEMYRKLGDLDFSGSYQPASQSYGALKFSKPSIAIDDIFQQSYKLKDEPSRIISTGEAKKPQRSHTRNFSDFTMPVIRRVDSVDNSCYQKTEENKLKWLESRVSKIEEMLKMPDIKLHELKIVDIQQKHKKLETQTEHKLHEINSCLSELKLKVEKINGNFTQHSMNLFNFRSEMQPSSGADLSNEKINKFVDKITEVNHMLIETIRKQFKTKLSELNQKVRALCSSSNKAYEQAANPENQFFKINRKYNGNPISFLYEQYIKRNQKSKQKSGNKQNSHQDINASTCLNQITYYIDPEGFLLDDNNNYLVNGQMKQIRLSERELRMLRRHNILLY